MDLETLTWSETCAEKLGVNLELLPEIRSNSEVLGTVKAGPMAGVPITGCLGDQQAALLGANTCASLCPDWIAAPLLSHAVHVPLRNVAFHCAPDTNVYPQQHCTV